MYIPDLRTACLDRGHHIRLLDVHMERVDQNTRVRQGMATDEMRDLPHRTQEIVFIPVDRLKDNIHARFCRRVIQILHGNRQTVQRGRQLFRRGYVTAHAADDYGCMQPPCQFEESFQPLHSRPPARLIRIRDGQAMVDVSASRPDRGQAHGIFRKRLLERRQVDIGRIRDVQLNTVVPQLARFRNPLREIPLVNKRRASYNLIDHCHGCDKLHLRHLF